MNNVLELVKVSLRESLDFRSMKKEKGKTITFGIFILLMGALFLFLSVVYNLMFAYMYRDFNLEIIYPTIVMVGFGSMLILTTSVARVKSLFIGTDYDMLASMPLTKREIIASKIITFYLTELLFSAIIMVPNIIINVILWNDLSFIPIGTIIMFLLPAFPVVISCFIGTIIAIFAEKSKFGNMITTLLYTVFFVIIMVMSFSFETGSDTEVMVSMTNLFKFLTISSVVNSNRCSSCLALGKTTPWAFNFIYSEEKSLSLLKPFLTRYAISKELNS
jgi:ABC-2 type transport system permease protein